MNDIVAVDTDRMQTEDRNTAALPSYALLTLSIAARYEPRKRGGSRGMNKFFWTTNRMIIF